MEETMKKNLSLLAAFLVVGFCATPASAADHYVSGMAGISWMNDVELQDDHSSSAISQEYGMGSGLALAGAVGCDYGDYRLEAELGYQKNDVKDVTTITAGVAAPSIAMQGDVSILSLMANGYYDFDLGGVELYATAGVGVAQVSFDGVGPDVAGAITSDVDETTLAYQIGAGLAAPIADNVKIDLRYRYFATTDFTLDDVSVWSNGHNGNVDSHSILLGLRVGF